MFDKIKKEVPARKVLEDLGCEVRQGKGDMLWSTCPYSKHSGSTVAITTGKEVFYCRECKKGDNIFSLVKKLTNCDSVEAAKRLAKKYKVDISEEQRQFEEKKMNGQQGQQKKVMGNPF